MADLDVDKMLEPEQILHASMILAVESENVQDDDLILKVQEALSCDSSDYDAALSHIEQHRDGGNWGGRSEAVLHRSRERLREAMDSGTLPSEGPLADSLNTLIGDDDDGEIDPFAELGVSSSNGGSFGSTPVASDDPLAAFMDDEDDDDDIVDESGYFSGEQPVNSEEEEELVVDSEPTVVEPEEEIPEEPEQKFSPIAGYEMLMSTCWIDGILDPAEAKLLSRKRAELGITFEQHLEILRKILESSS